LKDLARSESQSAEPTHEVNNKAQHESALSKSEIELDLYNLSQSLKVAREKEEKEIKKFGCCLCKNSKSFSSKQQRDIFEEDNASRKLKLPYSLSNVMKECSSPKGL
jgi:hypothetical protein